MKAIVERGGWQINLRGLLLIPVAAGIGLTFGNWVAPEVSDWLDDI